jgi:hypothetical protein
MNTCRFIFVGAFYKGMSCRFVYFVSETKDMIGRGQKQSKFLSDLLENIPFSVNK